MVEEDVGDGRWHRIVADRSGIKKNINWIFFCYLLRKWKKSVCFYYFKLLSFWVQFLKVNPQICNLDTFVSDQLISVNVEIFTLLFVQQEAAWIYQHTKIMLVHCLSLPKFAKASQNGGIARTFTLGELSACIAPNCWKCTRNWPVSQYERPRAVALASSACVDKTTKIITEFTRKDPFLHQKQAN